MKSNIGTAVKMGDFHFCFEYKVDNKFRSYLGIGRTPKEAKTLAVKSFEERYPSLAEEVAKFVENKDSEVSFYERCREVKRVAGLHLKGERLLTYEDAVK